MISLNGCYSGVATSAPVNSLVLGVGRDRDFLVIGNKTRRYVIVSDADKFVDVGTSEEVDDQGLVIPNVRIEVDPDSRFDLLGNYTLGAISLSGGRVSILTRDPARSSRPNPIEISDCSSEKQNVHVGFRRWRIVVGEGTGLQVLRQVDLDAEHGDID
ncbi:hypothetical protein [Pseudoroseicyclus tamaricis]|uniref:Uncharacterized protein n=1 Tax=Pseudoroseicyclus tamaricis TaxID=2705421 RepID=A0A6B2JSB3_9RHOB|nr:hypothetical protein [Pseudoroseicyclus tamaricis]NDV00905.1 hypothetical protein [Pseudoroseicyclus tamaricis]